MKKITDYLQREELRAFTQASDFRGWLAVGTTWAMIATSFGAVAWAWAGDWEGPAKWAGAAVVGAAACVILGGRHLALAILMHETAHHSLFRTRWLNDWVGLWLCAAPTWQDLRRYRPHHIKHHRYTGTPQDPDLDLVTAYPVSRASLARKFARDLLGISGARRVYGLLLMDAGFIGYTVSNRVERLPKIGWSTRAALLVRNTGPVVVTNLVLAGLLWGLGWGWLYGLWVLSYLTTFSLFLRIRSIAEHACTELTPDFLRNSRTTHASWIARLTVAPHRVNHHLEHHLMMTAPYFVLPRLHQVLRERGALSGGFVASSYSQVVRGAIIARYSTMSVD